MNIYSDPAKYGLETIGEVDWSDGCYQFDLTVVWRRPADGAFLYGEDAGCSCPSPFESTGVDGLTPIASPPEFAAHLEERKASNVYGPDPSAAIAELLERMHKAGAR